MQATCFIEKNTAMYLFGKGKHQMGKENTKITWVNQMG